MTLKSTIYSLLNKHFISHDQGVTGSRLYGYAYIRTFVSAHSRITCIKVLVYIKRTYLDLDHVSYAVIPGFVLTASTLQMYILHVSSTFVSTQADTKQTV